MCGTSAHCRKLSRHAARIFLRDVGGLHLNVLRQSFRTLSCAGQRSIQRRLTKSSNTVPVKMDRHQTAHVSSLWTGSARADIDLDKAKSMLQQYPGGSVDLEKDSVTGIAVITLNNPGKKNALSGKMMLELTDIVSDLEGWDKGKGLIIRGSDQFFCSGVELGMVKQIVENAELGKLMTSHMHDVTSRILSLPLLSLALIEGGALGGGAEMSTGCDFRIATENSKICFLQVRLGVVTGFGAGTRLVQILGRTKALDLMCSSRNLTAAQAEQFSLLDAVIPGGTSDESLQQGKQWLSRFTQWDATPLRAAKKIIHSASTVSVEESLHIEKTLFSEVWGNPVHRKAIGLEP